MRFQETVEDREVPGHPGVTFLVRTRAVRCLHPQWPKYAIDVGYRQRYPSGAQPTAIEAEIEPLLRSLRFTPQRPLLVKRLRAGKSPRGHAFVAGSLWVANSGDNTVSRIDPQTDGVTATIPVGKFPLGVAVGEGAIWVANHDDGTVSRIDPATDRVVATIDVGGQPFDLAVGFEAVWVTDEARNSVARIDPRSNRTAATIPVGQRPNGLAVGEDSVWVANVLGHTVSRIDPTGNRVVATIKIGLLTCCPVYDVEVVGGTVWAIGLGAMQRIDPVTNRWVTPGITHDGPPGFETYRTAVGAGLLWVTETGSGTVSRFDPEARKFVRAPSLIGGSPTFVTVGGGAVWITDQAAGIIVRLDL